MNAVAAAITAVPRMYPPTWWSDVEAAGHQRLSSPAVGRRQQPVPAPIPVNEQEERQEPAQDCDGHDGCRRADEVAEPAQNESPD